MEVSGWAKADESIKKWKIVPTKKAVDFLKPVYKKWNLDTMDGSMIGGLAAIQTLAGHPSKPQKAARKNDLAGCKAMSVRREFGLP